MRFLMPLLMSFCCLSAPAPSAAEPKLPTGLSKAAAETRAGREAFGAEEAWSSVASVYDSAAGALVTGTESAAQLGSLGAAPRPPSAPQPNLLTGRESLIQEESGEAKPRKGSLLGPLLIVLGLALGAVAAAFLGGPVWVIPLGAAVGGLAGVLAGRLLKKRS